MRSENAPAGSHKTIYRKDYKAFPYEVEGIDLLVQIFEGRTVVTSDVAYRAKGAIEPLVLNGEAQVLISVHIDGQEVTDYRVEGGQLTLMPPAPNFRLKIVTENEPEANTSLSGFYKSGDMYCTQCESEGFRRITYYPDRPDVMSVFTCRLEADKAQLPVLLSNGNLTDEGVLDDGRHFAVWHDPFKKPAYLFAMVAGNLEFIQETFKTHSGRDVLLRIYTRKEDISQADFGMEALIQSMEWDEIAFGREYDLDIFNIVAVGDFNFGAMENKSLNIFNTACLLARPELSTDDDFLRIRRIIGHEYFHNWSGNRVTCRDWFQLSLKEGFTVYRENQFGQAVFDRDVERIDEVNLVRTMQFPEDAGPMAHPIRPDEYIEITNFYTMTVYEKGGEVIRMLRTLLGEADFRKACDLYFERHDGEAATCDDFVKCMADASGRDMSQFMLWYEQAGTPRVKASGVYDSDAKTYALTLEQSVPPTPGQPNKKPMLIPVAVGLINDNGQDMDLGGGVTTKVLELSQERQTFVFENIGCQPVVSILRGFSAPVEVEIERDAKALRFLMVHDSDGLNQWDAGQTLMKQAFARGLSGDGVDASLIEALKEMVEVLRDSKPALLARMLTLPEDSIIAAAHTPTDPAKIASVRRMIEAQIATGLSDVWLGLYEDNAPKAVEFDIEPASVAKRALRNVALYYHTVDAPDAGAKLAKAQYETATNMTERMGALRAVISGVSDERELMLADFYERFKEYPLVVDKWFSLQATAQRQNVVDDVKQLMSSHPAFGLRNPNRVRALIGAFGMRNMAGFHHPSGEGYRLVTDVVLQLNTLNPQVGARLLTPMRQWKSFAPELGILMKAQLERILEVGSLAPDIYEVVTKTLEG